MRSDMSKVITERPRYGHQMLSAKTGVRIRRYDPADEYEDQPKRLPVSGERQHGYRAKTFSDFLNPLRRYLKKNVGRPWDKVLAEMKAHLDNRSVTGRHVFEHINMEVEQHCFIGEGGKVYANPRYGVVMLAYGFYVHPRTGLLRWKEGNYWKELQKAKEEKKEIARIRVSETRSYIKIDGIWYLGDFAEWTKLTSRGELAMPPAGSYEEWGKWMAPVRKKQCSKAELKATGLSNDDLT